MDFTLEAYKNLIKELIQQDYTFQTFEDFLIKPNDKVAILRHDVDKRPTNSLRFAEIQNDFGINGTYYFRAVPYSWDENIVKKIKAYGNEIGYHYENLTVCKGNFEKAIEDFKNNLESFRKLVPISTICMHGSPKSKYDSKLLWKMYNYRDFELKGEPYFDVDFNKVLYMTDTGRRWDGNRFSVRDKVDTTFNHSYNSTFDIIDDLKKSKLPAQIMFNFHPQRWHNNYFSWTQELISQNIKNQVKQLFYVQKT